MLPKNGGINLVMSNLPASLIAQLRRGGLVTLWHGLTSTVLRAAPQMLIFACVYKAGYSAMGGGK